VLRDSYITVGVIGVDDKRKITVYYVSIHSKAAVPWFKDVVSLGRIALYAACDER
jgi:hypothetical protein